MQIKNVISNTFIPSNNTQRLQAKPSISLKPQLRCDTVSFGSRDLLSYNREELTETIKQALIDKKNFIGQGAEAEVFKIPNSDYCVRVLYKRQGYGISNVPELLNKKKFNINYKLSKKDIVNHVVAKFPNGTIMKLIEGLPVKAPSMSDREINSISKTIQDAPISSFQKLLHQISFAYDNNMMFDCNYANIIVNPKNKSLTAIDFYDMKKDIEIPHPLSHIYSGITHAYTTEEQKKIYARKILGASLEEVKLGHIPCIDVRNLDFYKFIYKLYNEHIISNHEYTELLVNTFSEIEKLKLKELSGENVKTLLNSKIKIAKNLIKQLL